MATLTTTTSSSVYVKVKDTAVLDALIQNTGTADVLLVFSAGGVPVVDTPDFHILKSNDSQAVQVINGVPSGNAYVRAYSNNLNSQVAVST